MDRIEDYIPECSGDQRIWTPQRIVRIHASEITVNPKAQRDVEVRKKQFKDLLEHFDPDKVNPIVCNKTPEGLYTCIDGQMTLKVLKTMAKTRLNIEDPYVPVLLKNDITEVKAAELFAYQSRDKSNITASDRLRVLRNYGEAIEGGKEAQDQISIPMTYGFSFGSARNADCIKADTTLEKAYNTLGKEGYSQLFYVIKNAWQGVPQNTDARIIAGLATFMSTYQGEFDVSQLAAKLKKTGPKTILRDTQEEYGGKGARDVARTILAHYNKDSKSPKSRLSNKFVK